MGCVGWLAAALFQVASSPAPPASPPARLALLIGIDEYDPRSSEPRPASLSGAKSDIACIQRLLTTRFQFLEDSILVRLDAAATHARIVQDFKEWLIDRAGPSTEVLFWFSGHGSQCPDAAHVNAEAGQVDSTFVAYDSRLPPRFSEDGRLIGRGGYDFTDDELHSLLRVLATKTSRITVITDACHSGGGTRGVGGDPLPIRSALGFKRPLTHDDIEAFWPPDVPFLDDDAPERGASQPWVHLAACAFDEVAHEHLVKVADGKPQASGAFTWFLARALEQAEPGITYERLARRVGARLSTVYRAQQVQAEGEIDRQLFSAAFSAPPPGFAAEVEPPGRTVRVFAGALQLIRTGSRLRIEDELGRLFGEAEVNHVTPTLTFADLAGEPRPVAERTPMRAIVISRPREVAPLQVYLPPGADHDALAAQLAASHHPVVEVSRDAVPGSGLEIVRGALDEELRVRGEPFALFEVHSRGAVPTLTEQLAEEQRYRELLALGDAGGSIAIDVHFEPVVGERKKTLRTGYVAASVMDGAPTPGRRSGLTRLRDDPVGRDVIDLVVALDPALRKRSVFVTVLCVSEDRTVTLLHPPIVGERENVIMPGTPKQIAIEVMPTRVAGGTRDGVDRILVIATERYADFRPFVNEGRLIPATEEPRRDRGGEPLPLLLEMALAPAATRGAGAIAPIDESFGVAVLDFQVVSR